MRTAGHGGSAHRRLPRPGGPAVRLAGVIILLALAALGSAARGITHLSTAGMLVAGADPVTFIGGAAFVTAACLVLAGVLALLIRRRRRPEDDVTRALEPVGPWWVRALVTLAALALITLPVAALVMGAAGPRGRRRDHLDASGPAAHGAVPGGQVQPASARRRPAAGGAGRPGRHQ